MIICAECEITSNEHNGWVPCKRIGKYLCWHCCKECEFHTEMSGTWSCRYLSDEQLRERNKLDHKAEFQREVEAISAKHWAQVRERQKKEAIIRNRRRAKAK